MALFIGIMNEEIVIEMNLIIVLIEFLKYSKLKKCVKNTQMKSKSVVICFSANHSRAEFNS
jgi:hypothetical protein